MASRWLRLAILAFLWLGITTSSAGPASSAPKEAPAPSPLAEPQAIRSLTALVSAYSHNCVIDSAQEVQCWGYNAVGQLGDGTKLNQPKPVRVRNLSGVTALAAGVHHTCALTSAGAVLCWGDNGFGQLGDGSTTDRLSPTPVSGLQSGVIAIGSGLYHACAALNTGQLRCWGQNDHGQLGNNSTTTSSVPVLVSGLSGVAAVTGGMEHTCARTSSGAAYCWGGNFYGQVGDASTQERHLPVGVSSLGSGVASIEAGSYHTCATTSAGAALCWGMNGSGQLGDGATTHQSAPVPVSGLSGGVSQISAGGSHTCALAASQGLLCWGWNNTGQLGDNTSESRLLPTPVLGLSRTNDLLVQVSAIAAGGGHTCALTSGSAVTCFGDNGLGQLGEGIPTVRFEPVPVRDLSAVRLISAGGSHTCAVGEAGLHCWGWNDDGQLGVGTFDDLNRPAPVSNLADVFKISAGTYHTCGVSSDRRAWCWGRNAYGEVGDNTTQNREVPVDITPFTGNVESIAPGDWHTCALTSSGGVKCWGLNDSGQLGDNSNLTRLTATNVSTLTSGAAGVAAGFAHSCALTSAGGVKCWGANSYGQLGNSSTLSSNVPVQVVGLESGVRAITAGAMHTCALLNDGRIRCWGYNFAGQLGNGTTNNWTVPVLVSVIVDAVAIDAGYYHTCAVTSAQRVYCWGYNNYGQLGDQTNLNRSLPVVVQGLPTGASAVSAGMHSTCARLLDGQVYCWGSDSKGQLGIGTPTLHKLAVNTIQLQERSICSVEAVPAFYQGSPSTPLSRPALPPWYADLYGSTRTTTIGQFGCNLTGNAMIINYYGRKLLPIFETGPGILNQWLQSHAGYTAEDYVDYSAVARYAADEGHFTLGYDIDDPDETLTVRNQRLREHLCAGDPALLKVALGEGDHWVVATGVTETNAQTTFTIYDPIRGETTLLDQYAGQYQRMVLYSAELGTQDLSMLEISAHSPVHLLLVDPQGRQTGYDPRSGEHWDEIPMGGYLVETITAPSGLSLPESKLVLISKPTQGRYLIRAIGYEAGDYRIDVQQTFPDGSTQVSSFSGSAEDGSLDTWSIDFSQEKKVYFPTTRKQ